MVTASHKPQEYNGLKFVREGSRPLSGDSGLREIETVAADGSFTAPVRTPGYSKPTEAYLTHLLSYMDLPALKPMRVVVNAGNGCADPVLVRLEPHFLLHFIKVHHEPDSTFPYEVPNPLLPENRRATAEAMRRHGAEAGLAWDGDFECCSFFAEQGGFIEGYYIVGFLAQALLARHPGAAIIHDLRLTWNTIKMIREAGGVPKMSKSGHACIKEHMWAEKALYGREMSGHLYFRDFAYFDSGMIPWLLVLEVMNCSDRKLSDLIVGRMARFPVSGEINRPRPDPDAALLRVVVC
jgi:phosphomannomutase